MGYKIVDLGTHSIRKGVTTYASSGTTAAPSGTAVNIRGGSFGTIEAYMMWDRVGNQYAGRLAAGLDVLSPEFAVLHPDFIVLQGENDDPREGGKETEEAAAV